VPLPMELQEAQRGFWFNTLSKDTIAAYQTRKAKWIEFSTRFQRSPNDLSPKNFVDYITYLATIAKRGETPLSYASIKVYVDFLGRATSFTSPLLPNPVQHPEVQLFLRGVARTLGKTSEQGRAMHLGTSESTERLGIELSDRRGSTVHGDNRDAGVLGLSSSRRVDSEAGRQATTSTEAPESRNPWDVNHRHSAYLKDDPVRQAAAPHRSASAIRSSLVPLESIDPLDLHLATPILPDIIVRAVHDQSYNAVSFAVPDSGQPCCPIDQSSFGSLLPSGLRSSCICSQCAHLASDASWRLEDPGGGHGIRQRRTDPESFGRLVQPRPVTEGWFPPD
jgi:hypothetical protein